MAQRIIQNEFKDENGLYKNINFCPKDQPILTCRFDYQAEWEPITALIFIIIIIFVIFPYSVKIFNMIAFAKIREHRAKKEQDEEEEEEKDPRKKLVQGSLRNLGVHFMHIKAPQSAKSVGNALESQQSSLGLDKRLLKEIGLGGLGVKMKQVINDADPRPIRRIKTKQMRKDRMFNKAGNLSSRSKGRRRGVKIKKVSKRGNRYLEGGNGVDRGLGGGPGMFTTKY